MVAWMNSASMTVSLSNSEVSSLYSYELLDHFSEGLVAHHRLDGDYSDSTFYGNSVSKTGTLSWSEDDTD